MPGAKTKTEKAANKLAADIEHERLTSLINSMADGVIATDNKTNVLIYNGAALNILDLNTSIQDKPISSVMKVVDRNNQPIDIRRMVLDTRTSTANRDLQLCLSDGSRISLYLSIAPVHLGYGQDGDHGFVLLLRDITHEKSLEEERDEFISVVSHELRTPVAIVEGNISNAKLIADKTGNLTQIKAALTQAHEQIMFLSSLINDLSTLSRAERGKLTVEIESINVHALVKDLYNSHKPETESKGLELHLEADPQLELLKSSELYVREILQNFITNAIKYTNEGQVTIGAKARPDGVLFQITDTGIGISKGEQERVFDKFFRSEDYRTRANSGTGLGLYVSMKLARLLHAEINLESELNKGSTFSIFIPNLE